MTCHRAAGDHGQRSILAPPPLLLSLDFDNRCVQRLAGCVRLLPLPLPILRAGGQADPSLALLLVKRAACRSSPEGCRTSPEGRRTSGKALERVSSHARRSLADHLGLGGASHSAAIRSVFGDTCRPPPSRLFSRRFLCISVCGGRARQLGPRVAPERAGRAAISAHQAASFGGSSAAGQRASVSPHSAPAGVEPAASR